MAAKRKRINWAKMPQGTVRVFPLSDYPYLQGARRNFHNNYKAKRMLLKRTNTVVEVKIIDLSQTAKGNGDKNMVSSPVAQREQERKKHLESLKATRQQLLDSLQTIETTIAYFEASLK